MQPTLNPGDSDCNDIVLADKWSIKLYRYRRGDVVLLRYSGSRYRKPLPRLHMHNANRHDAMPGRPTPLHEFETLAHKHL
jgi:hypothetical protein